MKVFNYLLFLLWLTVLVKAQNVAKKPHIIIIISDDMGWNDVGFHGSNQIPTPNIDALGYNGVIFDKFYTQQSCTPSRAALLTGNYPIRSGLQGTPIRAGENRFIPLDMPTLPERLKQLGYRNHLVGKWHLGAASKKYTPTRRGFDTHFGFWSGYVGYFSYEISEPMPLNKTFTGFDLHNKFTPEWELKGQYATELFTKKSLEIIENHNEEEPLFLMLAHLAPHAGHNGTELGVPNITRTDEIYSYINCSGRRKYADIINILDGSVGQIVHKLSKKNMLENSIVLFFSDNGAQTIDLFQNFASGWPLRGLKYTLLEGGVRGTAALYSPLLEKKGYINKQLIHITDWLPTLYYAAGGNISDLGDIDGINQWPVISRGTNTTRTEILLNIDEAGNSSGILGYNGQYKLINGTFELGIYDQYYGEDGRGAENPAYDVDLILTSPTNIAIQKISSENRLKDENIINIRTELDISWCRDKNNTPHFVCHGFCLFDIFTDPCETTNIIDNEENINIVTNLKQKLSEFYRVLVPQKNHPVDQRSNPSYFNNTWDTWLDITGDKAT